MKSYILTLVIITSLLQFVFAGGNTSLVDLKKVSSIKIEDHKITIVGSGMLRKRVMTDTAHGDSTCFGQPTQMLHAKVTDCVFEVVPYFVRDDLKGVLGPDSRNLTPEIKALSEKWWKGTLAVAKTIKIGDAIGIGYQSEKMTLTSVYVTKIVGSGSLNIKKVAQAK